MRKSHQEGNMKDPSNQIYNSSSPKPLKREAEED